MSRLPDRIPGEYSAHLPIPGEVNASGLWSARDTEKWKRRARNVKSTYRHLQTLGANFFESYQSAEPRLAVHLRDLAIAQAIAHSLVVCQYRSETFRELTPFARFYWKNHGFSAFWDKAKRYRDYYYGGYLGSVAFSLFRRPPLDPAVDPFDLLREQLDTFWRSLDLTRTALENKYPTLLDRMNYDLATANQVAEKLLALYDLTFGDENYDLKQQLLAGGVLRGEVRDLAWRIPHLQVKPTLVQVSAIAAQRRIIPVSSEWIKEKLAGFARLAPPGGIDTVYQALIAEAYLTIADVIENDSRKLLPLAEWEEQYAPADRMAGYFAFIGDALKLSRSLFSLDATRDYIARLTAYYLSLRDNLSDLLPLRLSDRELPSFTSTLRPPQGNHSIILSADRAVRAGANVRLRSLSESVEGYLCDLTGTQEPISVSVDPEEQIISVPVPNKAVFVVASDPIFSFDDLSRTSFHSTVVETTNVDQSPPYQP